MFAGSQAIQVHLVLVRRDGSLLGRGHRGVGQADVLILPSAWGIVNLAVDVGQDTSFWDVGLLGPVMVRAVFAATSASSLPGMPQCHGTKVPSGGGRFHGPHLVELDGLIDCRSG